MIAVGLFAQTDNLEGYSVYNGLFHGGTAYFPAFFDFTNLIHYSSDFYRRIVSAGCSTSCECLLCLLCRHHNCNYHLPTQPLH